MANDDVQLDNYVQQKIESNYAQRYKIEWNDDNIDELEYVKTDKDKLVAVKTLIQLMNEVDPKLLNRNNYYQIANWYKFNDYAIWINQCQ